MCVCTFLFLFFHPPPPFFLLLPVTRLPPRLVEPSIPSGARRGAAGGELGKRSCSVSSEQTQMKAANCTFFFFFFLFPSLFVSIPFQLSVNFPLLGWEEATVSGLNFFE